MTAETPGQAAYEAMHASRIKRTDDLADGFVAWSVLDETLGRDGLNREDMDAGAQAVIDAATEGSLRACGYTLADVGRFLEAEAAAQEPQPAPGDRAFRADLVDAMLRWSGRDRADVDECASELAVILDRHPMAQPSPGLADAVAMATFEDTCQQLGTSQAELEAAYTANDGLSDQLAARTAVLTEVLGWFASNGSGHYARVSGTVLAREYAKAGLPLPDSLKHLAGR